MSKFSMHAKVYFLGSNQITNSLRVNIGRQQLQAQSFRCAQFVNMMTYIVNVQSAYAAPAANFSFVNLDAA